MSDSPADLPSECTIAAFDILGFSIDAELVFGVPFLALLYVLMILSFINGVKRG